MNAKNLVKMANQIGAFFEFMPDREQAVKDVAAHILRNWAPSLRLEFLTYITAHDVDLKIVVRDALPLIAIPPAIIPGEISDGKTRPTDE
jgi:formate dehydrogenase subunit delta